MVISDFNTIALGPSSQLNQQHIQGVFNIVSWQKYLYWFTAMSLVVVSMLGLAPHALYANEPTFAIRHSFGTNKHTESVMICDVDGDGDLDIITGNYGEQNVIYQNDGKGNFTADHPFGTGKDKTNSVAVGDVDGDGDLDIVVGNIEEQNMIYLNDGKSNFTTGHPFGTGKDLTYSVAVGDVDGDGDLDIVAGNYPNYNNAQQSVVYLNHGEGNFIAEHPFGTGNERTESVALGDLDSDGDLDIVTGNYGQQNVVYLNDSSGNFITTRPFGTGTDYTKSVVVGDVDGDTDLDIVTGNDGQQNMVYLNDGTGNFDMNRLFGTTSKDNTRSVVVGDVDGDGDLDIVAGNYGVIIVGNYALNTIYLNDGAGNFPVGRPFRLINDQTNSVAVGDLDGDGHLDIITGNDGRQSATYLNDGAGNFDTTRPFGTSSNKAKRVAVGDMDGDGDLDIVTGNGSPEGTIYLNNGVGNFDTTRSFSFINPSYLPSIYSVAVGDMDGDGDLDIVAGNRWSSESAIYLNDGVGNFGIRSFFGTVEDKTKSVAVGDVDGDSDLDIVTGNSPDYYNGAGQQNVIYLNDGTGNFTTSRPLGDGNDSTESVVLGDLDSDGDLDIVVGNWARQNVIYLNDSTGNFATTRSFGTENDRTHSVAVGDVDGDGDLDIVTGTSLDYGGQRNSVYLNDSKGNFILDHFFGPEDNWTNSVAVIDVDGDGDLDIVTGNQQQQNMLYLNDGAGGFGVTRPIGTGNSWNNSVAVGDIDSDGDGDLIIADETTSAPNLVYLNRIRQATGLVNQNLKLVIMRPGPTPNANFFSSSVTLNTSTIAIPYKLFDTGGDHIGRVEAFYSLDGGGRWLPAVAATGTITQHLTTAPTGIRHVFNWDTFASGFFGQSDNVVVRLVAYSQPLSTTQGVAGTYRYTNTVAGPYQWPFVSAATFPFRVRGTQVRVVANDGKPVADALVYRLGAGQVQGALPFGNALPFRTNAQGYLTGRGQMAIGDRLVALTPVLLPESLAKRVESNDLHFYYTSASPDINGLAAKPVTQSGVQTLTVSTQNPLLLFDLKVALEWDARKDPQYLAQLEFNLKYASALLYDWSNGQMALGKVTVYHDAPHTVAVDGWQPWQDAHIRIYANNTLRPSASQGGIITDTVSETVMITNIPRLVTYNTGQVRMGATWNRYGESGSDLGEDWSRALAHELGHYLLFLDDNYLGLDTQGRLITIRADQCPGAMNNPYSDLYSEFHPLGGWLPGCQQTLTNQEVGRPDWATITTYYPMLKAPTGTFIETVTAPAATAGPNLLPLAVTQIDFQAPITPAQTLEAPIFSLIESGGGIVVPGNSARAYLFPVGSQRIVELGRPTLDQVLAYGARPGDRLCVYEPAMQRQGCIAAIQPAVEQLVLKETPNWQPEVRLTPITSNTLQIHVTTAIDGILQARLYPVDAPATPPITLTKVNGVYTGVFYLAEPALEGYVQVWMDNPAYEVLTSYVLGGNPVHQRSRRVHQRSRRVHQRSRRAPVASADGQVVVFGDQLEKRQDEEWIYTVQAATAAIDIPAWTTVVGQPYWLVATPNAPDLLGATIGFQYLSDDVPTGEETFLRIYYREEKDATLCPFQQLPCWRPLETNLDTFYNFAAAALQGPGLYALMSSIELPLTGAGWNLFAYPVQGVRPVAEALQSINGAYSVVWGYDPTAAEPWHFYAPDAPAWANDLTNLQFGKGYWLHVTAPGQLTLYLKGNAGVTAAYNTSVLGLPAVYYGTLSNNAAVTPAPNMTITASVDGKRCGTAQTQAVNGQIVYMIKVAAEDGSTNAGCGTAGRIVTLALEGTSYRWNVAWDNTVVKLVDLLPTDDGGLRLFLPLIAKK